MTQHHGLPTRLLDWTTNPLTALFFAIENPTKHRSAVWSYRSTKRAVKERDDPFAIDRVHFFRPAHVTHRITGQLGYFTAHPFPYNELQVRGDSDEHLFKIEIRNRWRPKIRRDLDRIGVNHASMFPDLDGTAKHLRWTYTLRIDEEDHSEIQLVL